MTENEEPQYGEIWRTGGDVAHLSDSYRLIDWVDDGMVTATKCDQRGETEKNIFTMPLDRFVQDYRLFTRETQAAGMARIRQQNMRDHPHEAGDGMQYPEHICVKWLRGEPRSTEYGEVSFGSMCGWHRDTHPEVGA